MLLICLLWSCTWWLARRSTFWSRCGRWCSRWCFKTGCRLLRSLLHYRWLEIIIVVRGYNNWFFLCHRLLDRGDFRLLLFDVILRIVTVIKRLFSRCWLLLWFNYSGRFGSWFKHVIVVIIITVQKFFFCSGDWLSLWYWFLNWFYRR